MRLIRSLAVLIQPENTAERDRLALLDITHGYRREAYRDRAAGAPGVDNEIAQFGRTGCEARRDELLACRIGPIEGARLLQLIKRRHLRLTCPQILHHSLLDGAAAIAIG